MEWSSSCPLTGDRGVTASAPRPRRMPSPRELQRESIYIYWKEMIFLRFTCAPYLLKYICSGLRVKCSRLRLFLTCSLLPSSPSSGLTLSLLIMPLGGRTTPRSGPWKASGSACARSHTGGSKVLRASPRAVGAGCDLGAADL